MRFRAIRGKQIQQLGMLVENFTGKKKTGMNDILRDFDGLDEEQEEELKKLLDKEKEMREKENDDGNQMNRWKKDVETNTADRERKIKERKVVLAEKSTPRTISILRTVIRLVFLLIMVISSFSLYPKISLRRYFSDGESAI